MEWVAMGVMDPLPETNEWNKYVLVVADCVTKRGNGLKKWRLKLGQKLWSTNLLLFVYQQ